MPLRRFNAIRRQQSSPRDGRHGGVLFARKSTRGTIAVEKLNFLNEASVLGRDPSRQSLITDGSSSVGEDHRPVDLDKLDEKMAERELIRYFEEGGEKEAGRRNATGPIDLDLLEDNFHCYDRSIDDVEDNNDMDFLVNQAEDFSKSLIVSKRKECDVKGDTAEAKEDQVSAIQSGTSECSELTCEEDNADYSDPFHEERNMGETGKSAPVDMDEVYDLETTFDSILDEHEGNFMVWTANRKSVNAILIAEEQASRRAAIRKFGQSLRRERKSWSS
ncbi:hypothetical protein IV203_002809 [Nitzschia inconspicua]|uniref:Uncharacterized protein n=1 Tax=Nitzschia inconspicua TaxID=303405 RepID=A0A9K3L1G5_9STRA|nr:hypothetical protein IV203_002809 [Nitzschia inconspicua]